MTQYFEGLTQEAEIKTRYKELAKKFHPDLGGSLEAMKEINNQYEKVMEGAYQRAGKSITEIEELLKNDAELRDKLSKIITLEGLDIEICGSWLWITGDTKTYREIFKTLQFFWANQKKAWYFRSDKNKSYNRKSMSLEEIRYKHGSLSVKGSASLKLG